MRASQVFSFASGKPARLLTQVWKFYIHLFAAELGDLNFLTKKYIPLTLFCQVYSKMLTWCPSNLRPGNAEEGHKFRNKTQDVLML